MYRFAFGNTQVPSITVKTLGKVFDCSLRDAASIRVTYQELEAWLVVADKSGLPGMFRAWIYQHGILPWIFWPLLVYEVLIPIVEGFERTSELVETTSEPEQHLPCVQAEQQVEVPYQRSK